MAGGVVTVGQHQYAVGLYWENAPGSGHVAQIAKEAAKQPGQQADFYVVRPGNKEGRVPQFGLCSSGANQKAGMPVLAACMASQNPGSWAGAFRFDEGIALIIVRDDLIVPDGDLLFREESEARDRLIQEVGFGGLQTIYAPESWSIPGADSIPLSLLLNNRTDIQLQRVTIPKNVKIAAAAAAAAFFVILGTVWYVQQKIEEDELRQQDALRRAQQAALPSLIQQAPPPEPKYDRRWESAPLPMSVVKACQEGLSRIPAGLGGWTLSNLSCNGSSISLSWARTKGATLPPEGASVNETGSSASQVISLSKLDQRGPETLKNVDENTNRYLAQDWPGSISRATDDPLPPPPPDYKGPWNPPPPPWVKRSFTLTVQELPGELPGLIGDLPGAIVSSMRYTPGSASSWIVEGVIYENRR